MHTQMATPHLLALHIAGELLRDVCKRVGLGLWKLRSRSTTTQEWEDKRRPGGGVEQPEEKQKEGCALALGHKKEAAARL